VPHSSNVWQFTEKTQEILMVNQTDDQRAQELNEFKRELTALALRLDAFEARSKRRLTMTTPKPSELNLSDIGLAKPVVSTQQVNKELLSCTRAT
jgi:hypothetical protein